MNRPDSRTVGRSHAWFMATLALVLLIGPSDRSTVRPSNDVHAEYVKYLSGSDTITAYLAYPERRDPAPGVIVIHEIFGISDFIRQTTERLAKSHLSYEVLPEWYDVDEPADLDRLRKQLDQLASGGSDYQGLYDELRRTASLSPRGSVGRASV